MLSSCARFRLRLRASNRLSSTPAFTPQLLPQNDIELIYDNATVSGLLLERTDYLEKIQILIDEEPHSEAGWAEYMEWLRRVVESTVYIYFATVSLTSGLTFL
jgi:hypothetical protein